MVKSNKRRMVKRKNRKVSLSRVLLAVLGSLGSAVIIYIFFFTTAFELREVRLHGGRYLPADSLQPVADRYIGSNVFMVPLSELGSRLMAHSQVYQADFRRRPLHRIDCYIQERVPVALLALEKMTAVDDEGVLLLNGETEWEVDLPVITGISLKETGTEAGKKMITNSLKVLRLLKEFDFSPAQQLSEIHIDGEDILLVWMSEGTIVQLGRSDYLDRVRKFRAVYSALQEDGEFPEFIDLRFDRQVVIR
ncbi:MAG: cell division protein FtsQ/DivIB [Candidatus Krumholzibacteria bacterium]|nr:cell division protein FtsQ/DivIB [Candidatus Krumholzibacteria bacterium]